ncbi:MAG: hypothetical protein AUI36_46915, partial [Cyanobacteria bacterium 13_1_40CM_2_61_4]
MGSDLTRRTSCRICDNPTLFEYLDLGEQPLANAFLHREDVELPEFTAPLRIQLCERCGLSQLTHTVAPERMYSHYLYCSGVSNGWREHCVRLAQEYTKEHGAGFVLEIAANDGTLLSAFKALGCRVLGIEPAQNILQPTGVPMLPVYWDSAIAQKVAIANGKADLIVATNVLGHVDNVLDFLDGIRQALDRWGIVIIECPHIMPLLYLNAFDTIYHEHLSYWSLRPLQKAATQAGLSVFDCKPQPIHGGTMRYYLCHLKNAYLTDNLVGLWKREDDQGLRTPEPYREFGAAVRNVRPKLVEALKRADLWGFGASAKGNTLLNYAGARLHGIFDDSPTKQGLFTPGTHIPVQALPDDLSTIAALALLSWNWGAELKQKARERGFKG